MINIEISKCKSLKYWFIAFILIQPLLDTHYLFTEEVVSKFLISPSTLVRIAAILIFSILVLYKQNWKKKYYVLVGYILAICLYTVIHIVNGLSFHSLVPGDFNFSALNEIFYIIRLILPMLCIFIVYNLDIGRDEFRFTILSLVIIISGLIVVTNIFKISMDSYANQTISDNIFSWFTNGYKNYGFYGLASKAFFNFANQIAAILCMLLPLCIYFFIQKIDIMSSLALFLQPISMLMLGTKVSTYGSLLIIVYMIVAYCFFVFVKKELKFKLKTLISIFSVLLLVLVIFPKSPALYRQQIANNTAKANKGTMPTSIYRLSENAISNCNIEFSSALSVQDCANGNTETPKIKNIADSMDQNNKIKFIENNYERLKINKRFITKSYPYQYDPDFWYEILHEPIEKRLNYRYLETSMIKRVKEINNNSLDTWFGIGFSRVSNIYNIERDFVNQYYSMGLMGVLLFLFPFVLIVLWGIYQCLRYYKEKFNIFNFSCISSILLVLGASYFSGNSLDALTVTIILAFICGIIIKFNTKVGSDFNNEKDIDYNANL